MRETARVRRYILPILSLLASGVAACDSAGSGVTGTEEEFGTAALRVTAHTEGEPQDTIGYIVSVDDGEQSLPIPPNGSVTFPRLSLGLHTLQLFQVPSQCQKDPEDPVEIELVDKPGPIPFAFLVACPEVDLVFHTDRDGNPEVYKVEESGMNLVRLTTDPFADHGPATLSGLTRIAFTSGRETATLSSGSRRIFLMETDGTDIVPVTGEAHLHADLPAFSPSGNELAFCSRVDGDWEIHTIRTNGTDAVKLTDNERFDCDPAWGPNGMIAFTSDRGGSKDIWLIDPATPAVPAAPLVGGPGVEEAPHWAPNGTLAFQSDRDGDLEIYIVDPGTGAITQVTDDPGIDVEPAFSPSGARLAFASNRDGDFEIYIIDLEHHEIAVEPVQVTDNPALDRHPDWID